MQSNYFNVGDLVKINQDTWRDNQYIIVAVFPKKDGIRYCVRRTKGTNTWDTKYCDYFWQDQLISYTTKIGA